MYEIAPVVEVTYRQIGTDEIKVMRGSWHVQNEHETFGPLLVMNPAAHDVPNACCWTVPWCLITRITVIDPGVLK